MSERYEVSRLIQASPAAIFAVLADPAGHVRIDASGMLQSTEAGPVTSVGDTFVVHMDRESLNDIPIGKYDAIVHITRYEPDTAIEWTVGAENYPPVGHLYGYELAPDLDEPGATRVTSYYDWSAVGPDVRAQVSFPVVSEATTRATLGILARTTESG